MSPLCPCVPYAVLPTAVFRSSQRLRLNTKDTKDTKDQISSSFVSFASFVLDQPPIQHYDDKELALVSSKYGVAALAKTVRERDLHRHGLRVRHRVEVRIQPRHEALAASRHDARGLETLFVILETALGGEAGHPDVVAGFAVALRIAEIDDVDGVMVR